VDVERNSKVKAPQPVQSRAAAGTGTTSEEGSAREGKRNTTESRRELGATATPAIVAALRFSGRQSPASGFAARLLGRNRSKTIPDRNTQTPPL